MMCIDCVFFFKQKTAYEMRISDWSSDVCSSDLDAPRMALARDPRDARGEVADAADGRQDPDFVARPDAAVGTEIARKGPGGSGDGRCTGGGRRVTIVAVAAQRGRQIVAVDMLAGCDFGGRGADRKAIFGHRFPARAWGERALVPTPYPHAGSQPP